MSRREINEDMLVYENGHYKAYAVYDENSENPFDSWDMLGRFAFKDVGYIVCNKKNYDHLPENLYKEIIVIDDVYGEIDEEVACGMTEYMELHYDALIVIPLTYYGEMHESDDEARGCIYISKKTFAKEYGEQTPEHMRTAREVLEGEIELHNYWGSGEVFGWAIFDVSESDGDELDMSDHIDACWGYYGGYPHKESGLYGAAKEMVDWLVKKETDIYEQSTHFPAWKFMAFLSGAEGVTFK